MFFSTVSYGLSARLPHFEGSHNKKEPIMAESPTEPTNPPTNTDTWQPSKLLRITRSSVTVAPSTLTQMLKALVPGQGSKSAQNNNSIESRKHALPPSEDVPSDSEHRVFKRPSQWRLNHPEQTEATNAVLSIPRLQVPPRKRRPTLSNKSSDLSLSHSKFPLNSSHVDLRQQLEQDLQEALGEPAMMPTIREQEPETQPSERLPLPSHHMDISGESPFHKTRSSFDHASLLHPHHETSQVASWAQSSNNSIPHSYLMKSHDSDLSEDLEWGQKAMILPPRDTAKGDPPGDQSNDLIATSGLSDSNDSELNREFDAEDEGMFALSPKEQAKEEQTKAPTKSAGPSKEEVVSKSSKPLTDSSEFYKANTKSYKTIMMEASLPRHSLLSQGINSPEFREALHHNRQTAKKAEASKAEKIKKHNQEVQESINQLCNKHTRTELWSRMRRLTQSQKKELARLNNLGTLEKLQNHYQALNNKQIELINESARLLPPRLDSTRSAATYRKVRDSLSQELQTVHENKTQVEDAIQQYYSIKISLEQVRIELDKYTQAAKLKTAQAIRQALNEMPDQPEERLALSHRLAKEFSISELTMMKDQLNKKDLPVAPLEVLSKAIRFQTY